MPDLNYRKKKIQDRRKQTPRRAFVMELCSRYGMTFYRTGKRVDGYPDLGRIKMVSLDEFEAIRGSEYPLVGDTFMEQFASLYSQHPFPHILHIGENENSQYAACIYGANNAYLSTEVIFASNVLYSAGVKNNSDMILSSVNVVGNNANIYMSNTVRESYNIFYSKGILGSSDIWFSSNLQGCTHCIRCSNLQNASYHIDNICYPQDEYERIKKDLLHKTSNFETRFESVKSAGRILSPGSTGMGMIQAKNVKNGLFAAEMSESRNVFFVGGGESNQAIYDTVLAGTVVGTDLYAVRGASGEHYYCCMEVIESSHIFYSMYIENCSYCLGCIGLRNKSYCIFNKQYTKDQRHEKVDELFTQMDASGTLGDFFHGDLCPLYFNDTVACLIDDSFTPEEVKEHGYARRDEVIQTDIPASVHVVKTDELNGYESYDQSGEWTIDPEILKKVIQDEDGNVYRIIPMEYKFLKKYGLPLPRKHRLARLKQHFTLNE